MREEQIAWLLPLAKQGLELQRMKFDKYWSNNRTPDMEKHWSEGYDTLMKKEYHLREIKESLK